jgi:AcrR family transcriptional regulator
MITSGVEPKMSAPTRAGRALATRRRMVQAAYGLFCTNGYAGTTISAVAEQAGVAVPTVYYTFGAKAALLDETLGAAILGFDLWREPPPEPIDITELLPWHTWWADFEAAPTPAGALDIFITHGARILQRVGPLIAALHGTAGDPEAAEVARRAEERRVDSYREAIRVLAHKPGGLRQGLTMARATDIVVALFSAELYQAIADGRGWSHAMCLKFFQEILTTQLLDGGR